MGGYFSIFIIAVIAIVIISLIYTIKVVKQQSVAKAGIDEPIPKHIQSNPYVKNPIFWAYIIGFGFLLLFIFYLAGRW
ncbi:hypothetical protein QYG89_03970 [Bacillus sp. B190/17]|uniref:Short-chain dehydrogenase n=1 Tax=Bacillus lumedeiriae TaxID=3058829 RepID=A0ABW8I5T2_9BACI